MWRERHPLGVFARRQLAAVGVVVATSLITSSVHALEPNPSDAQRSQRADKRAPIPKHVTLTFSPVHLGYTLIFVSSEVRLLSKLGVGLDAGLGGYHGATAGQLGLRAVTYPAGSFDTGGLQLGLFARATRMHFPNAEAVNFDEIGSAHRVMAPFYNDIEFARANGKNAVFAGLLIGGKLVAPDREDARGATAQGGFLFGSHHLVGESRHGPSPDATRTRDGFLAMLYLDLGWSL
jgi:hypothetical protein